jgi:tRNA pseudouridine38-40 synthase
VVSTIKAFKCTFHPKSNSLNSSNPNAKTIEGVLIEALHKANAIPDHHVNNIQKIQWMRACRTDKGVSALGNIVSCKLQYNRDESMEVLRDRTNSFLPPHVKIYRNTPSHKIALTFHVEMLRTLGGFHCKNAVDYRVYDYLAPTYAFVPIIAGISHVFQRLKFRFWS